MNSKELIELISEISHKSVSEIESNLKNDEFFDSLLKMEVIFAIEDKFSVTFLPEEIEQIKNIFNVIQTAERKI